MESENLLQVVYSVDLARCAVYGGGWVDCRLRQAVPNYKNSVGCAARGALAPIRRKKSDPRKTQKKYSKELYCEFFRVFRGQFFG